MNDVAIILAAGGSTRFGRPKQLLELEQETLVARAVRIARAAGLEPLVVLGHEADAVAAAVDARTLVNPRWADGMGTSIAAGAEATRDEARTLTIVACDQVRVDARDLRRLHDALVGDVDSAAARYAGVLGVPAVFRSSCFDALCALSGDVGARDLLRDTKVRTAAVDMPHAAHDMDYPTDVEQNR